MLGVPVHPTCQIRLRQISALRIVQPLDFLHTRQIGRHDFLAFSCAQNYKPLYQPLCGDTTIILGSSIAEERNRTIMVERKASTLWSELDQLLLCRIWSSELTA
jgi:hypothetical protein